MEIGNGSLTRYRCKVMASSTAESIGNLILPSLEHLLGAIHCVMIYCLILTKPIWQKPLYYHDVKNRETGSDIKSLA